VPPAVFDVTGVEVDGFKVVNGVGGQDDYGTPSPAHSLFFFFFFFYLGRFCFDLTVSRVCCLSPLPAAQWCSLWR
jgi:hypothetical protein